MQQLFTLSSRQQRTARDREDDLPAIVDDLVTWKALARRETRIHVKGTGIWIIGVLLVAFHSLSYSSVSSQVSNVLGADTAVLSLQVSFANALLIGGLLLGHTAITDERTTGVIKLTASIPHSRPDIVVGKLIGLTIPLVAIAVLSLAVAADVAVVTQGVPSLIRLVAFGLVSAVYALVCAGLGILISSTATTTVRAAGAMVLSFVVVIGWKTLVTRVYAIATGARINMLDPPADGVLFLARRLDPRSAYFLLTNWVYGIGNAADVYPPVVSKLHSGPNTTDISPVFVVETSFEHPPRYLTEPTGVVVVIAWVVLSIGIAVYVFRNADL